MEASGCILGGASLTERHWAGRANDFQPPLNGFPVPITGMPGTGGTSGASCRGWSQRLGFPVDSKGAHVHSCLFYQCSWSASSGQVGGSGRRFGNLSQAQRPRELGFWNQGLSLSTPWDWPHPLLRALYSLTELGHLGHFWIKAWGKGGWPSLTTESPTTCCGEPLANPPLPSSEVLLGLACSGAALVSCHHVSGPLPSFLAYSMVFFTRPLQATFTASLTLTVGHSFKPKCLLWSR